MTMLEVDLIALSKILGNTSASLSTLVSLTETWCDTSSFRVSALASHPTRTIYTIS